MTPLDHALGIPMYLAFLVLVSAVAWTAWELLCRELGDRP